MGSLFVIEEELNSLRCGCFTERGTVKHHCDDIFSSLTFFLAPG